MNVGCLGEGEETIVDLLGLFLENGSFSECKLAQIPGIVLILRCFLYRDRSFNVFLHVFDFFFNVVFGSLLEIKALNG